MADCGIGNARILFVDQCGALGGGELSLLDIARAWRATSEVILFEDGPFRTRLNEENIPVTVHSPATSLRGVSRTTGPLRSLLSVPSLLLLAVRVARHARSFDLLYANSQKALLVAALAGCLSNRPVVWHLRDLLTDDHLSASNRWIAVAMANAFASQVICNSEATCSAFVASGGRADRVNVVPNGIDATPFNSIPDNVPSALRAELGIPHTTPLVGVFSRLAAWKGQDVLLRALVKVPDLHAIVVGDALFDSDHAYAASLPALADELGIAPRVHFLGFRDDIPALMRTVDIVCHTSTSAEPFGRVIVEGMLACRPVVAARAGGALEIIDEGRTGFLVPPGNVCALSDCLRHLLDDPAGAARLAAAGRTEALHQYSLDALIRNVHAVLSHLRLTAH